jgi:hypothetical protein
MSVDVGSPGSPGYPGSAGSRPPGYSQHTVFCHVDQCRFSGRIGDLSHVTSAHYCGICHQPGHGQMEHGRVDLIQGLEEFMEDVMPEDLRCDIEGCEHPYNHSRQAHHCGKCGARAQHGANQCTGATGGGHRPISAEPSFPRECAGCKGTFNTIMKIFPETNEECTICSQNAIMFITYPCGHKYCKQCLTQMKKL